MAGHLAAQEAVWAGAPTQAHAVLPLPLCSVGPRGWGPGPSPRFWVSPGHRGTRRLCVRAPEGPGGTGLAGGKRSASRASRAGPGGFPSPALDEARRRRPECSSSLSSTETGWSRCQPSGPHRGSRGAESEAPGPQDRSASVGVHVCACVCLWVSVGVWGDREVPDVPVRRQELRTFRSATAFTVRGNVSADVRVRGHTPWCLCVPPVPSRGRVCRAGAWVQASVWERVRARPPQRSTCTRARARRPSVWYTLVCVCVCVCVRPGTRVCAGRCVRVW